MVPGFPRRSLLIDAMLGLGDHAGHRARIRPAPKRSPQEKHLFNLWVLLGAQYR